MTDDGVDRAREIFKEAIDLSGAERDAFVETASAGDESLRDRVDRLLQAFDSDASKLDETNLTAVPSGTRIGGRIGRFRILEMIGEGGFGEVWLAEQTEPVRRRVAVKIIKRGMDSAQVVARFEAERQALAMMEHPNIARVYDGGETDEGQPYFVMELVKGMPITEYCERRKLGLAERIRLFGQVCAGVQHAHQKGVIHRDLKPSNVLVCEVDDKPVAKVIDFGIAKALERPLTDKTLFTEFRQFIGTPEYMSPEQADLSLSDVDTRSDVYALGVMLYELLAGQPPFDPKSLRSAGFDEMRRIIREEEPPPPSIKLSRSGTGSGIDAPDPSDARLSRLVRGELDWIVQRAMAKERDRRYASASEFDDDLERYLNGEAVRAGPVGKWYRSRRFMARNRVAFAITGSIAVALVAGIIATSVFAVKAERQRQQAQQEFERAEAVKGVLTEMLLSVDPKVAGSMDKELMTLVLKNAATRIDEQLQDQPLSHAELSAVIGTTYISLGMHDAAEPHLIRALELSRVHLGDEHPKTLSWINDMGILLAAQGRYDEAMAQYVEALGARRRVLGDEHLDTLASINSMGLLLVSQGKYDEALAYYAEGLEASRRVLGDEHPDTLTSMNNMGNLLADQGKYDDAMKHYIEALDVRRRVLGDEHPHTLSSIINMGVLLYQQGRYEEAMVYSVEALEASRLVFGDEHPNTLTSIISMGSLLVEQGSYDEAMPLFTEALEGLRRVVGAEHPQTLVMVINMGALHFKQGKYDEAMPYYAEALEVTRRVLGDEHPYTLVSIKNMGNLLGKQGRYEEAMPYLNQVLETNRRVMGDEHPSTISSITSMGNLLVEQGNYDEAMPYYVEALETNRRVLGDEHPMTLGSISDIGLLHSQQGRYEEAMSHHVEALETRRRVLGDAHPDTLKSISEMGVLHARMHEVQPEQGHDVKAAEYMALHQKLSGVSPVGIDDSASAPQESLRAVGHDTEED
jgi:serine/threonine protein kinase/Tfp pilus assembly protein PilF